LIKFVSFNSHIELVNWEPETNVAKITNQLSPDSSHVTQKMEQGGWSDTLVALGPLLRFEPSNTAYALININNELQEVNIEGLGWRIVKWEIVATDLDGGDLTKAEVVTKVDNDEPFFICDKLTWRLDGSDFITKHGYQHY